jgi:glycosyltransferase XagB
MGLVLSDPATTRARPDEDAPALRPGAVELPPELTAASILDRRQRRFLVVLELVVLLALVVAPLPTLIAVMTVTTIAYLATVVHRVLITHRSLHSSEMVRVSDAEARAIPDSDLPMYTVLVPAYHEASVVPTLLATLDALDYPRELLDVKLLLEADDDETIAAATANDVGHHIEIVLVPPGEPRTKPRALGFGLRLARGELVTIFDAEDHPDPLQLRRAVAAFRTLPPDVVCLQGQLTFHNTDQNIITRWFTIEYLMWFTLFLPGLAAGDAPIPLGGTSNHIKREVLESVGAWDPFNVTEDADLGLRLHRLGMRTAVLDSRTYEEANSDFVNWVKQRSRWYKGYLQTALVHLRHPIVLWRAVGPSAFFQMLLFVGGTPLLALLNPLFWLLTIGWFVGMAGFLQQIFPAPLYHVAMVCWVVGNFTIWYLTMLAARRSGKTSLVWAALLVPGYWVMMSLAAVKAGWQIIAAPSHWEKTTHGLTDAAPVVVEARGGLTGPTGAPRVVAVASNQGVATTPVPPAAAPGPQETRAETAWSSIASGLPSLDPARARSPGAERAARRAALLGRAGHRVAGLGFVLVAFVVYLVVGTAWNADRAQDRLAAELASVPVGHAPAAGDPVARLRIPRIGLDQVVVEGAARSALDKGPAHVHGSGLPGGHGRVVILGHRSIGGGPFGRVDELGRGARIVTDAPWGSATYRVTGTSTLSDLHLLRLPARSLALVTSGSSLLAGEHVVVHARLVGRGASAPDHHFHSFDFPDSDAVAFPLLLAWCGVAALSWRSRRWLPSRWGPVGRGLLVAPLVAIAVLQAFEAASHLLPATF